MSPRRRTWSALPILVLVTSLFFLVLLLSRNLIFVPDLVYKLMIWLNFRDFVFCFLLLLTFQSEKYKLKSLNFT